MPLYIRQKRFPLAKFRRRIDGIMQELDEWSLRYSDELGQVESVVLRNRLLERLGAIDKLWHELARVREGTFGLSWH